MRDEDSSAHTHVVLTDSSGCVLLRTAWCVYPNSLCCIPVRKCKISWSPFVVWWNLHDHFIKFYCWVYWWQNVENRSTFGKVM